MQMYNNTPEVLTNNTVSKTCIYVEDAIKDALDAPPICLF